MYFRISLIESLNLWCVREIDRQLKPHKLRKKKKFQFPKIVQLIPGIIPSYNLSGSRNNSAIAII